MHVLSTVKPLLVVLKDMQEGKIRVPILQRQFVWSADRMLKLFDSIKKGYPIGSILLWDTDERFLSRDRIGIVETKEAPPYGTISYLLDGQQRLTTLLSCLYLPEHLTRRQKWRISYDADKDTFRVTQSKLSPAEVPVTYFADGFGLSKFLAARGFQEQAFRRAQQVGSIFQLYQLPVITLMDAKLDQAVDVFGRLNTLGKVLTAPELAAALAHGYSEERPFDLDARFSELLERLKPFGLDTLSRTTLLRAFIATLGEQNIYTTELSEVIGRHRSDLNSPLDILGQNLERAAQFLRDNMGVAGAKSLAYGFQLIVLSEFFRRQTSLPPDGPRKLEDWLWHSAYTLAYAGSSVGVHINQLIDRIRTLPAGEMFEDAHVRSFRALPFPVRYHPRSARVRAFLLFLKQQAPRNPKDGQPIPKNSLLAKGFSDTSRIVLQSADDRQLANRVLVGSDNASRVFERLKALQGKDQPLFLETLQSHLIPLEAWDALLANDYDKFLRLRQQQLVTSERAFLEQRGIELPPSTEQAPEELDEPLEAEDIDDDEG